MAGINKNTEKWSRKEMIQWLIDVYGFIDSEPEEAKRQLKYLIDELKKCEAKEGLEKAVRDVVAKESENEKATHGQ